MARTMTLALTCLICNKLQPDLMVDPEGFRDWNRGTVIQEAMPYLTPDEREMVISQTCSTCWDKLWNGPDEDENLDNFRRGATTPGEGG